MGYRSKKDGEWKTLVIGGELSVDRGSGKDGTVTVTFRLDTSGLVQAFSQMGVTAREMQRRMKTLFDATPYLLHPRYERLFDRWPARDGDGSLIGWRYWDLDHLRSQLRSPVQQTMWTGPVLRADGWSEEDAVRGAVGVHAAVSPAYLPRIPGRGFDWTNVYGRVRGSGRYVVGDRGWRAEVVTIDRLYLPRDHWSLRDELADRYQCTVRPVARCFEEYVPIE